MVWVQTLVRELISYMPHGAAKEIIIILIINRPFLKKKLSLGSLPTLSMLK